MTLDFNHRPSFAEQVNAAVDAALTTDNATRAPRDYLGGSRLGHACERALQFEFTHAPKDEGQDFSGQLLRIFAIGHALEDLAVARLRGAGLDLYTRKGNRLDGGQFGFSIAAGRIRGHVDGIIAAGPEGFGLTIPALWECKTMNAKNWRACVKDGVTKSKLVYAAQIAVYQAYMDATIPGIAAAPALFTAINKDTAEMHHELVPFDADLAQLVADEPAKADVDPLSVWSGGNGGKSVLCCADRFLAWLARPHTSAICDGRSTPWCAGELAVCGLYHAIDGEGRSSGLTAAVVASYMVFQLERVKQMIWIRSNSPLPKANKAIPCRDWCSSLLWLKLTCRLRPACKQGIELLYNITSNDRLESCLLA